MRKRQVSLAGALAICAVVIIVNHLLKLEHTEPGNKRDTALIPGLKSA